jgi:hypothetical protein
MTEDSKRVATAARQLYDLKLRAQLETEHEGQFLCIEPISGRFFLGNTFDEAVNAALDEFPRSNHAYIANRSSRPLPPGSAGEMKGHVDQSLRALIDVSVAASRDGAKHCWTSGN